MGVTVLGYKDRLVAIVEGACGSDADGAGNGVDPIVNQCVEPGGFGFAQACVVVLDQRGGAVGEDLEFVVGEKLGVVRGRGGSHVEGCSVGQCVQGLGESELAGHHLGRADAVAQPCLLDEEDEAVVALFDVLFGGAGRVPGTDVGVGGQDAAVFDPGCLDLRQPQRAATLNALRPAFLWVVAVLGVLGLAFAGEDVEAHQAVVDQPEVVARQRQVRSAAAAQPAHFLARADVAGGDGVLEADVVGDGLRDDPGAPYGDTAGDCALHRAQDSCGSSCSSTNRSPAFQAPAQLPPGIQLPRGAPRGAPGRSGCGAGRG